MRYIFLFFLAFTQLIHAQQINWKKVDSLANEGLYQSAIESLNTIVVVASKQNQWESVIKANTLMIKYNEYLEEDHLEKSILVLDSLYQKASFPSKNIYASILASTYWSYQKSNNYLISDLPYKDNASFSELNSHQILELAEKFYKKSVEESSQLQTIKTEELNLLITGDAFEVRPRLYDLLMDLFLQFYQFSDLVEYEESEEVKDSLNLFKGIKQFKSEKFFEDTYQNKIARLYQSWLKSSVGFPYLESNVNLMRLSWAMQERNINEDEYLNVLSNNAIKSPDKTKELYLLQMCNYVIKNNQFLSKNNLPEAHRLLTKIKRNSSNSLYVNKAKYLLSKIELASFQLEKMSQYKPDVPVWVQAKYKNVDSVKFNLFSLNVSQALINNKEDGRLVKTKTIAFAKEDDFINHSTSFLLPALSTGNYYVTSVLYSGDTTINNNSRSYFKVSNVLYAKNVLEANVQTTFYDFLDGNSVKGLDVDVYTIEYRNRKNRANKISCTVSDAEGRIKHNLNNNGRLVYVVHDKDGSVVFNSFYANPYRVNKQERKSISFFTNKPVYKPANKVQFKGFVHYRKNQTFQPIEQDSVWVEVYTPNYELYIERTYFKTNEYGSFQFEFDLMDEITGSYQIRSSYGTKYIDVQSYVKPNYQLEVQKPKKEYAFNDSVQIEVKAVSYSGINKNDVEIEVNIYKQEVSRYGYLLENKKDLLETIHLTSDAKGIARFSYQFIQPKDEKSANYLIEIKGTDQQGETHTATENILISEKPYYIRLNQNEVASNNINNIYVTSVNNSNSNLKSIYSIKLFKVKSGGVLKLDYPYGNPNYSQDSLLFKEYYTYYFQPQETIAYDTMFVKAINSKNGSIEKFYPFKNQNLKEGNYVLEITSEVNGNKEIEKLPLQILNWNSSTVVSSRFLETDIKNNSIQLGDPLEFYASSDQKMQLNYQWMSKDTRSKSYSFFINNNKRTLSIDLPKEVGPYVLDVWGFKYGKVFRETHRIVVRDSNQNMELKLKTFSDKTQPGKKENWSIQVLDAKGKGLESELLLNAYDLKLDEINRDVWQTRFSKNDWVYSNIRFWQNGTDISSRYQPYIKDTNQYNVVPVLNSLKKYTFRYSDRLGVVIYGYPRVSRRGRYRSASNALMFDGKAVPPPNASIQYDIVNVEESEVEFLDEFVADDEDIEVSEKEKIQVRSNFKESIFFYTNLQSDKGGEAEFSFTMPDALTTWKFRALAITKDGRSGYSEHQFVSSKELMVELAPTRFLREGDDFTWTAQVSNLQDSSIKYNVHFKVFDSQNDSLLFESETLVKDLVAKNTATVSFPFKVPDGVKELKVTVAAETENHKDLEQRAIPVLSRQILVEESLPFTVLPYSTKELNLNIIDTLVNKGINPVLKINLNANSTWELLMALPYYGQNDQVTSLDYLQQYVACKIALKLLKDNPNLYAELNEFVKNNPAYFNSSKVQNLSESIFNKNHQFKQLNASFILSFYQQNNLKEALTISVNKLKDFSNNDNGISWIYGGLSNITITQYILESLLYLKKNKIETIDLSQLKNKGKNYLLNYLKKSSEDQSKEDRKHLNSTHINIMYLSKGFGWNLNSKQKQSLAYFEALTEELWKEQSIESQLKIALTVDGLKLKIASSLKEQIIHHPSMGMYWKGALDASFQNQLNNQVLGMELFEDNVDIKTSLFQFLLNQKRTQFWNNKLEMQSSIYALLKNNTNLKFNTDEFGLVLSKGETIQNDTYGMISVQPSISSIQSNEVQKVKNTTNQLIWGAASWTYSSDYLSVSPHQNKELTIKREYFKMIVNENSQKLIPIKESEIKVGDKIRVVLKVDADRKYDFVKITDDRFSNVEPLNTKSQFMYNKRMSYYQSIQNDNNAFYIEQLPRGTHSFMYDVYVTKKGEFTTNFSKVECLYATEFKSHGVGASLKVN